MIRLWTGELIPLHIALSAIVLLWDLYVARRMTQTRGVPPVIGTLTGLAALLMNTMAPLTSGRRSTGLICPASGISAIRIPMCCSCAARVSSPTTPAITGSSNQPRELCPRLTIATVVCLSVALERARRGLAVI